MQYFYLQFSPYYLIILVLVMNIVKIWNKPFDKKIFMEDMIVTFFAYISLVFGGVFQGILSDVAGNVYLLWLYQLAVILVISIILTIIYLCISIKKGRKK